MASGCGVLWTRAFCAADARRWRARVRRRVSAVFQGKIEEKLSTGAPVSKVGRFNQGLDIASVVGTADGVASTRPLRLSQGERCRLPPRVLRKTGFRKLYSRRRGIIMRVLTGIFQYIRV